VKLPSSIQKTLDPELAGNLGRELRAVWEPHNRLFVYQWGETNIVLSERQSQYPGPFSSLLTPYVREPLECFSIGSGVHDLTMCFGAQTSKTTTVMIGVAFREVQAPCPCLWIMPTEPNARSFSETRWQPMVDDCAPLAAMKPGNSDRYKLLEQHFTRFTLNFAGSNSPANLASRPIGLLVMDETDKFQVATKREAGALQLAEQRTKTFSQPLRVKTSTPTVPGGQIWIEFLKGDQRFYFVPCPVCEGMQRLRWPQVKWSPESRRDDGTWNMEMVASTAHYECEHCQAKITDSHKTSMLRKGEWRATAVPASFGRRSYHLNSLYAPWPACGFGVLAQKFLAAKRSLNGLQDFINSELAEPWEPEDVVPKGPLVVGQYDSGSTWPDAWRRLMSIDVQAKGGRHYWCVVRDWSKAGHSRLVWEGRFANIDEARAKQLEVKVADKCVLIDSGFAAREIYGYCVRFGWTALKAEDRAWLADRRPDGKVERALVAPADARGDPGIGTGAQGKKTCPLYLWSDPSVKELLLLLRSAKDETWTVPTNTSFEYHRQIHAQRRVVRMNKLTGKETYHWIASGDDHLASCENMQIVGALLSELLRTSAAGVVSTVDSDAKSDG